MASLSRKSNPINEDEINASTSNANVTFNRSRPSSKRPRYSVGSKYRRKLKPLQPYLGLEDENFKPGFRGSLHIDERFFPYGIPPRTILEIKGPEKSGKTFLLTYFIVRALVVYPKKKVLLIDTRHKFNVRNFVSILCHFDKEISNSLGKTHEECQQNLSRSIPILFEEYPQILNYLDRVRVVQCFTPEDLMLTFGPPGDSVVQNLLLQDENVGLVAVDSIDNFSYSESIKASSWAQKWPNIMHNLKNSVNSTWCPVICTTLMPADKHVYHLKHTPSQSKQENGNNGSTSTPHQLNYKGKDSQISATPKVSASVKSQSEQKEAAGQKYISNFSIDYTVFTNILQLTPVPEAERKKLVHHYVKTITHCANAYLRSRHNANTAGSGGNHRVKFSIFSDMLWVIK